MTAGFTHLIIPKPDPVVENRKQHDVVDKRFQSSRSFRYRESLLISYNPISPRNEAAKIPTYMSQELFGQRLPFLPLPIPIESHQSPTSL